MLAIKDGSVDLVILLGYDQDIYSFNSSHKRKRANAIKLNNPNDWLNQSVDKKTNDYSVLITEGSKTSAS